MSESVVLRVGDQKMEKRGMNRLDCRIDAYFRSHSMYSGTGLVVVIVVGREGDGDRRGGVPGTSLRKSLVWDSFSCRSLHLVS